MTRDDPGTSGYRALTEGLALLSTPRLVFALAGPRVERVVNGLVTNSIAGAREGRGRYAFVLTAKGRPVAELRVLPAPGFEAVDEADTALWLDVPDAAAEALREHLARFVPPIFATVEEPPIERLSIVGPGAAAALPGLLEAVGLEAVGPRAGLEAAGPGTGDRPEALRAVTLSRHGDPEGTAGAAEGLRVWREEIEGAGADLYLRRESSARVREPLLDAIVAAGGAAASLEDWEILRVERGLPRFGADITAENLPQETGQTDRAVSFTKGCYTGQEVVARIHYRGRVNRHLRGLRPEGEDLPAAGSPLFRGEREMGRVTSVVRSPRFGPIGLGYVRREIEPGQVLSTQPDGPPAVETVPLPFT